VGLSEWPPSAQYGLLVTAVVPNSPAARLGLELGDMIVSVDGAPVHSGADLLFYLNAVYLQVIDVRTGWTNWMMVYPYYGRIEVDGYQAPIPSPQPPRPPVYHPVAPYGSPRPPSNPLPGR
jgi:membrane-associated protease RseP (regulator of RpoE activity)